MNILDLVMNAQNGSAVRQIGSQFGLDEQQTAGALSALVPALAAGFQRNLSTSDGAPSLASALASGGHQRYVNAPSELSGPAAVADGNGILAHVLGGKDVSRQIAARAAAQTGLGDDVLKKILPLAASLMMGAFAQQKARGASPLPGAPGGGLMDMLTPLLDGNRDGSILDDLGGIAGRMFVGKKP